MRRKWAWAGVMLLLLGTLSGCWSNFPIERRDIVLMLGAAPAPNHQIALYFQVPTQTGLSSLTGSGGGGGGGSKNLFENITGAGATVGNAFSNAQGTTQKDLYLGQLQIVALSTRLSSQQFQEVVNWISRLGTFDKTADVVVSPSIPNFFQTKSPLGELPGLMLSSGFTCATCGVAELKREFWDVEKAVFDKGRTLWLPEVLMEKGKFDLDKVVFYRFSRPVMRLDYANYMTFGYLEGKTHKGYLSVTVKGQPVSIRALNAHTRLSTRWVGGRLHLMVSTRVVGTLDEIPFKTTPAMIHLVEKAAQEKIGKQELEIIREFQAHKVDPMGFGQKIMWFHQRRFPNDRAWLAAMANADVTVKTRMMVTDVGNLI